MTSTLSNGSLCELCVDTMEGIMEPGEEILFDPVEFVKFSYLGDRLNASGGTWK